MGGQALLKAVSAARCRQVRLLLDSGSSVNEADDCGQTALIRTIFVENESSRIKILKLLLKRNAVVSKADIAGRNALTWACIYGRDIDVELLLENADLELDLNYVDLNGHTPLYHAVSSGNASTVKHMVDALRKYDLSVDVPDYSGYSPLMVAARLGYDVCASILIQNGNAKVGLGLKYPKDFIGVEKWAVQSREKHSDKHKKLPSMLEINAPNNLKIHGGKSNQRTPRFMDSEDESLESDISSRSDSSSNDNFAFNYPIDWLMANVPTMKNDIPSSMIALSSTPSTIANASDDDEYDKVSYPVKGKDCKSKENASDLNALYGLVSDQMSTSYRLAAKPAIPVPMSLSKDISSLTLYSETSNLSKVSKIGIYFVILFSLLAFKLIFISTNYNHTSPINKTKKVRHAYILKITFSLQ